MEKKATDITNIDWVNLVDFISKPHYDLVQVLNCIREKLNKYPNIITRNSESVDYESATKTDEVILENKTIRVMQWNILSRALFSNCQVDKSRAFTSDTPEETYDWENFRKWRILEEILRFDNDIICLQEVDSYEEIKPFLHSLGYTSIFCPKYYSTCFKVSPNYGPDGCVIFYKMDKFMIYNVHFENFYFDEQNHDQVFAILQLTHSVTKKLFTIVCLHLKSKKDKAPIRTGEIKYMLQILKRHLRTKDLKTEDDKKKYFENHPILICGDFNGETDEEFYKLMMEDEDLKFENGYKSDTGPTTYKKREQSGSTSSAIDYIFYTPKSLNLIKYLKLPLISEIDPLPNLSYPSDHMSLICDFYFK